MPLDTPAGCQHQGVASLRDLDDLGDEGERADRTRVPARVVALGNHHVDAGFDLATRLARQADQAPYACASSVRLLDHESGTAEAGGEDRHALLEDHVQCLSRGTEEVRRPGAARFGALGRSRDFILFVQALHEVAVCLRDHLLEVFAVALDEAGGDEQVDAERLVAHTLLDPADVGAQLVRRLPGAAEDADPARVRDRHDHVFGVREGHDWHLAPVLVAQSRVQWVALHRCLLRRCR